MENLNKLLNTTLKTQNQNYISPDGKKNVLKSLKNYPRIIALPISIIMNTTLL